MKIKTGLAKNIMRAQVVEALRWNTVIITILMIIIVRS